MTYKANFKIVIGGFTLAEVLITLGIIGIVAAMTLPTVINNAQKKAPASRVHKFYNTMNNALLRSIADHDDVKYWMPEQKVFDYDQNLDFLKIYILPYIKYNHYEPCNGSGGYSRACCVYLPEGLMVFLVDVNGGDIGYYPNGKIEVTTRNYFAFQFNKKEGFDTNGKPIKRLNNKTTIEPYTFNWDGKYESLTSTTNSWGCNKLNKGKAGSFGYCTKLLQLNNWEITKDYPW